MHKFADLFCGIGGFRVALEREGMDCVFSCDNDPHVQNAYESNFGERPAGDITEVLASDIPPHDILCAGFPCQPFSRSGNREGLKDARGRLFYEIVRIANHHKPYLLILENVKTILTLDDGQVLGEIRERLDKIGYRVEYSVLNAGKFGLPQKRERVYFVCIRKDAPLSYREPRAVDRHKFVKDILLPDWKCEHLVVNRDDIRITKNDPPETLAPMQIGYLNKGGQGERIYSTNGHAVTISANGGGIGARTGLYLVNGKVRKLHLDETKLVMGFSKQHKVSDGIAGFRQLGNAVIPAMINHVYESVRVA